MKIPVNERIHLSDFRKSDQAACIEHLKEKEIHDHTLRIPFPYTEFDFQQWYRTVTRSTREQGRTIKWAVRQEEGHLIGGIGFDGLELGKSHQAEIGYWLAKPYWGQGIMTDAVRTVCQLAFSEFGLVKITAHVFAENIASIRVLEKVGFREEGYLRKHCCKEGRFLDSRLFALMHEPEGSPSMDGTAAFSPARRS